MRALDWLGRVLVLVLSTLATLSIVASLLSVSAPVVPDNRAPEEIGIIAEPQPQPGPRATSASEPARAAMAGSGSAPDKPGRARDLREIATWLRALTYAVLGLAGFVAVLVIVAMRATAHLGAIADRR